jgi:hypothetical protein
MGRSDAVPKPKPVGMTVTLSIPSPQVIERVHVPNGSLL